MAAAKKSAKRRYILEIFLFLSDDYKLCNDERGDNGWHVQNRQDEHKRQAKNASSHEEQLFTQ